MYERFRCPLPIPAPIRERDIGQPIAASAEEVAAAGAVDAASSPHHRLYLAAALKATENGSIILTGLALPQLAETAVHCRAHAVAERALAALAAHAEA